MAEELIVNLENNSYPIQIGESILATVGAFLYESGFPKRVALVCDYSVDQLYGNTVRESLKDSGFESITVHIGEGEEIKSLDTVELICTKLLEHGFDRTTGMIALGGGITGDLCGFASAIFLRGIPFVQIPTTLLAQVDSSVGGKTGVNHSLGKNLIGAFYQPKSVLIDVRTLVSLSDRDYFSGIAEVIKYGIILDSGFFKWICQNIEKIKAKETEALIYMVRESCRLKASVVSKDEKEGHIRAILNYGHTFGHAVESLTEYSVLHGEAVGVGMYIAAVISRDLGKCTQNDVDAIRKVLTEFDLATTIPSFSQKEYIAQVRRDKKVRGGKIRMVLNVGIGKSEIVEIDDIDSALDTSFDSNMQLKIPDVQPQNSQLSVKELRRTVQTLFSQGKRSEARVHLEKIIELDPSDGKAKKLLQSLPEPVESLESDPGEDVTQPQEEKKSSINTATIADIYVKQGLYKEALNVYQGILEDDPTNNVILAKVDEVKILLKSENDPFASVDNQEEAASTSLSEPSEVSKSTDSIAEQLEGWVQAIALRRSHV